MLITWICSSKNWDLEQREALELLLRRKDVFCDLPTGLFIRFLFMQRVLQVPCNGRQSLLSRVFKNGGWVDSTRLAAKMLLVAMNCFLCRVHYALEENVLTEQMWILAAYFKHTFHSERSWHALYWFSLAWFFLWCKSIFFFGLFRNVKFFIAAD